MFEPRGHDVMSGSILYPPTRDGLRHRHPVHRDLRLPADVRPRHHRHGHHGHRARAGDAEDAGRAAARHAGRAGRRRYRQDGAYVEEVRITNVPSFLYARGLTVECPVLGELTVDVAYGGNFYAIVEPQKNFRDMADHSAGELIAWSPVRARAAQREIQLRPSRESGDHAAVAHAVDRRADAARRPMRATPSSTATRRSTARPAAPAPRRAWRSCAARGKLEGGRRLRARKHHRLAVQRAGSRRRRASAAATPIIPSIGGWARMTGLQHDLHRRPRPVRARLQSSTEAADSRSRRNAAESRKDSRAMPGFACKLLAQGPLGKCRIRQRHCVVPMIAFAIVQLPGRQKRIGGRRMATALARLAKCHCIPGSKARTRGNTKRNATARRHSRGAA